MKARIVLPLLAGLGLLGTTAAQAATQAEFDTALSAASSAEAQAGALRNQWTVTETTLKSAREAGAKGDYDAGVPLAKRAEALANVSIAQAQEQDKLWRNAVIK